jgi:hypothetical protein
VKRLLLATLLGLSTLAWGDGTVVVRRTVVASGTANLLNETFNAAGYDLTWTEILGGGTIDEDSTVNPPVGGVTGFATQALHVTQPAFNTPRTYSDLGVAQTGDVYFRGYVYVVSGSTDPGESTAIIELTTTALTALGGNGPRIELSNTAGQLALTFWSASGSSTSQNINAATGYRVEFKFNNTTDLYEFRVDGATVSSGAASDPAIDPQRIILGVAVDGNAEIYWDKVGLGDNGWLGA